MSWGDREGGNAKLSPLLPEEQGLDLSSQALIPASSWGRKGRPDCPERNGRRVLGTTSTLELVSAGPPHGGHVCLRDHPAHRLSSVATSLTGAGCVSTAMSLMVAIPLSVGMTPGGHPHSGRVSHGAHLCVGCRSACSLALG